MTARPDGVGVDIPVKSGTVDAAALIPAVEQRLRALFPDRRDLRVTQIAAPQGAGINNETLLLTTQWSEPGHEPGHKPDRGVGSACTAGYVLRRETADNLFFEPDFADHFRIARTMRRHGIVPVPDVFGFDDTGDLLGARSYFMERVEGEIPADKPLYCVEGWMIERSIDDRRAMWSNLVTAMAAMHGADTAAFAFLDRPARGSTGFAQMLGHHFDYMDEAMGGERHRVLEAGADWLRRNLPDDSPTGFSWGDARPQNVIFGPDNAVRAIIDWDQASLGGPEADLGWWTMMHHSAITARGLAPLPGWGSPAETMRRWEQVAGRRLRPMHYYFVFATFRAGIIVRRLGRLLRARGALSPGMEGMLHNNVAMQYLASLIDVPPMEPGSQTWPEPC